MAPLRSAPHVEEVRPRQKRRRVAPEMETSESLPVAAVDDFQAHAHRRRQRYRAHWDAYLENQKYYNASETPVTTASPYVKRL
ncbi:hypothetical protein SDRG_03209 [Saprolegnia diclina VS20]|uniref:Uncharacterized protein n=1 Tax=Saprolegnia diclina (strain VS20) TaxID=1156394 RepID=T0QNT7_SAPDV|nr:hypothetical protein SDRG_03209 [Saprolegnia diclina VS20]EQC39784.1 hypothetical protein SDRG_03209 [Saprolegnia diclina VS20]|eukprot:XP_008607056.1 hypothetical protein SDRG_03209 [Saprolegnia diclina VS20]